MDKYDAVSHCRNLLRDFFLKTPCRFNKKDNQIRVTHKFCPGYPVFINLEKVSPEELKKMKGYAAELLCMRFMEEVAGNTWVSDQYTKRGKLGPSISKDTTCV